MSPQKREKFLARLVAAGGEVLSPTNPYEVIRFNTKHGVGVVYSGKRGETWNLEAIAARDHIEGEKGSLSPVNVTGRRTAKSSVNRLLERDGSNCFFCGDFLGGDITVEHLVAKCHGGPNHISNLFLAHVKCNCEAGHLSAPEKVALAIQKRSAAQ